MPEQRNSDTRHRLLSAAADLIAASPGQDVPLRAICDRAGVKLPTLYHFFGSKEGLLDAVIEHGFDRYLAIKAEHELTGDPIEDIRAGWDAHVDFGVSHPGFYALMYGQVAPGRLPAAQERATSMLRELTRQAAEQQRLAVDSAQAAAQVMAANVGVTLHQITHDHPDPTLSAAVRESTIAAITGLTSSTEGDLRSVARELAARLRPGGALQPEETALLRIWLTRLQGAG